MIVSGPRDTDCAFDSLDFTSTVLFDRQTPESRDQSNWTHRLGPLHHVIRELVDTEASYLQNLYELESCYFEPLQEDPSLDPESLSLIFGRIPALRRFHEDLLQHLERGKSDLLQIAEVFFSRATQFEALYSKFCFTFDRSIHLLEGAKKSRSELWCKLAQCQRTVGHQLSVDTYLLKPVQRILKYQLMLQQCVKRCLEFSKMDYDEETENESVSDSQLSSNLQSSSHLLRSLPALRQALDRMTEVANTINERKRGLELSERLRSSGVEIDHLGEFDLHGQFRLLGKKDPRLLLLYNKALVICKYAAPTGEVHRRFLREYTNGGASSSGNSTLDHYRELSCTNALSGTTSVEAREVFTCKTMALIENVPKNPLAFQIYSSGRPKTRRTFLSPNTEIKRHWCGKLRRLILGNFTQCVPHKMMDLILPTSRVSKDYSANRTFPLTEFNIFGVEASNKADAAKQSLSRAPRAPTINDVHVEHSESLLVPRVNYPQIKHTRGNTFHVSRDSADMPTSEIGRPFTVQNGSIDFPAPTPPSRSNSSSSGSLRQEVESNAAGKHIADLDNDFRCIALEINEERLGITLKEALTETSEESGCHLSYTHAPPQMATNFSCDRLENERKRLCTTIYEQHINRTKEAATLSPQDLCELWNPIRLRLEGSRAVESPANETTACTSVSNETSMRGFCSNNVPIYRIDGSIFTNPDAVHVRNNVGGKQVISTQDEEETLRKTSPSSELDANSPCHVISQIALQGRLQHIRSSRTMGSTGFDKQNTTDAIFAGNHGSFQLNHDTSLSAAEQRLLKISNSATPPPVPKRSARKTARATVEALSANDPSSKLKSQSPTQSQKRVTQSDWNSQSSSWDLDHSFPPLTELLIGTGDLTKKAGKLGTTICFDCEIESRFPSSTLSPSKSDQCAGPLTGTLGFPLPRAASSICTAPPKPFRRIRSNNTTR